MTNGATKAEDHLNGVEDHTFKNFWSEMRKKLKDQDAADAIKYVSEAKDAEETARRWRKVRTGGWKTEFALAGVVTAGVALGHAAGKRVPWKVGPVPLIAVVGFAGAAASLFIQSFFGRFALGLGGLTFGVGALMGARQCSA